MVPKLRDCCGCYQYIHGGTLFAPPQDDPQSVKVDSSYLSDRMFCPYIYFYDVFNFPIINDTLADKGLDIDFELRKGNVRASSMRIGVISTKKLKQYAKRMNESRPLRPPPFSLSKLAISRLEYE